MNIYGNNETVYKLTKKVLENVNLRLEKINDLVGLELSGSIKNVLAIASGIIQGYDVSDSTNAYFMVKSIRDLAYLMTKLGGKKETIITPCCLGDLILTSNSVNSRNYTYGELLTRDREEAEIFLQENTVEGYYTLLSIITLLKKRHLEIKIIDCLKQIILDGADTKLMMEYLK